MLSSITSWKIEDLTASFDVINHCNSLVFGVSSWGQPHNFINHAAIDMLPFLEAGAKERQGLRNDITQIIAESDTLTTVPIKWYTILYCVGISLIKGARKKDKEDGFRHIVFSDWSG